MCEIVQVHQIGLTLSVALTLLPLPNPYLFQTVPSLLSHIHTHAATGRCDAETTGFLSWPDNLAGTTRTLHCPNTTTLISRTCSPSGVWDSVDLTLCTSFASINTISSVSFNAFVRSGLVVSLNQGKEKP